MMEAMKRTYSRCHDLKERDPRVFGQPDDWLAAATNAGQPVAQAVTASELLLRVVMAGNHEMELDSVYFPDPTAKERNPRVLLQQALQSGNSEALLQVALTQDLFVPGRDRIVGAAGDQGLERQLVWLYLACSEGADCSSTSTWVASFCRDGVACPPNETGMELISREAALINVYDLAERAQVIKGQIARRQWDDLGIGRDSDLPVTAVGSD
jgi:hypothetical protein